MIRVPDYSLQADVEMARRNVRYWRKAVRVGLRLRVSTETMLKLIDNKLDAIDIYAVQRKRKPRW